MPIPDPVRIYRLTHIDNLEFAFRHGLKSRNSPDLDPNFVSIGHAQLIEDRAEHIIELTAKPLGDYVPFYFAGHSPMLLKIITGHGNVVQRSQNELAYIVVRVDKIIESGAEFVFSDRNAKQTLARFYDNIEYLSQLRWDCIQAKNWGTPQPPEVKDYKQSEFLVLDSVPSSSFESIVVFSEVTAETVRRILLDLKLPLPVYIDTNRKRFY